MNTIRARRVTITLRRMLGLLLVFCIVLIGSCSWPNRLGDVYLYDRGNNSLVSLPGLNSPQIDMFPTISGDGRYITFTSNRPGGIGRMDVYLYDRNTENLVPIPNLNSQSNDTFPAISGNGQYIAFTSDRPGGAGGAFDVYLYSRANERVMQLKDINSSAGDAYPVLDSEGRYLAFISDRPGGTGKEDVYLYDI